MYMNTAWSILKKDSLYDLPPITQKKESILEEIWEKKKSPCKFLSKPTFGQLCAAEHIPSQEMTESSYKITSSTDHCFHGKHLLIFASLLSKFQAQKNHKHEIMY